MRKTVMLIGVVAALVTQAEPKFADLLAKSKAGDSASAEKNYASEAIPVIMNLKTRIALYA